MGFVAGVLRCKRSRSSQPDATPLLDDSVEVHSPDGKILREFEDVKGGIFEVILPDISDAESITLMGKSLDSVEARKNAMENRAYCSIARKI